MAEGGRHGGGCGSGAVVRLRDDPLEGLSDAERKCLRASRFAPLAPSLPQPSAGSAAASSSCGGLRGQQPWAGGGGDKLARSCPTSGPQPPLKAPRLAHPGGPLATNKAAALARFLRRKIESGASHELDPRLVEKAVSNAQQILHAPTTRVKHVVSFDDDDDEVRGSPSGNASTGGSAGGGHASGAGAAQQAARSSGGVANWSVCGGEKQAQKRDRGEDSNGRIQGKRRKNGRKEHHKPKHKRKKGKNKRRGDD